MKRTTIPGVAFALGSLLVTTVCSAQQYIPTASAELAGGADIANGTLRRTRTRLRIGADLSIDESPKTAFSAALIAELEPRTSVGADFRYVYRISPKLDVNAGGIGILAPSSLYGATAGAKYQIPLSKGLRFVVGPELCVYFLGTDLPDGSVLTQLLLQGGIRVDL